MTRTVKRKRNSDKVKTEKFVGKVSVFAERFCDFRFQICVHFLSSSACLSPAAPVQRVAAAASVLPGAPDCRGIGLSWQQGSLNQSDSSRTKKRPISILPSLHMRFQIVSFFYESRYKFGFFSAIREFLCQYENN